MTERAWHPAQGRTGRVGLLALLTCLTALMGWLLAPGAGLEEAIFIGLFAGATTLLVMASIRRVNEGAWRRIIGEMLTPWLLWLFFGLGGLVTLFDDDTVTYYVRYESADVLGIGIAALAAGLVYMFAFHAAFSAVRARRALPSNLAVVMLTGGLLLFDWFARAQQIRNGVYFTWLAKKESSRVHHLTEDFSSHLSATTGFVVLALLTYLAVASKRRWLYVGLTAVQAALIAGQGSRKNMVFAAIIIGMVIAYAKEMRFSRRLVLAFGAGIALFLLVISPLVQTARLAMRADADQLLDSPSSIPTQFATNYLFTDEAALKQERQSLAQRLSSYMSYGATVHHVRNVLGRSPTYDDMLRELAVLVPRAVAPEKTAFDADAVLMTRMRFGDPEMDAPGTYITDSYAYLGLLGPMLLFGFGGIIFGVTARYLGDHHGKPGDVILIGLMPMCLPAGDAFVKYLAQFRSLALLLIVCALVLRPARPGAAA